jgi:uncharacterized protein YgiM (DUF1202 family)
MPEAAPTPTTSPTPSEIESGAVLEIQTPALAHTCATVTAVQTLNLRELPNADSTVLAWLPHETIVVVIGRVGEWWKVESAVGTGYAKADYLQESECR